MDLKRTFYGLRLWTIRWAFRGAGQYWYLLRTVLYVGYPESFEKRIWLNVYQQGFDHSHIIIRCTWQGVVLWYGDTCGADHYQPSGDAGTPDLRTIRC
jgi:hypothetical protein